jgi:autotransporter-associated beta strand protein
MTSRFVVTYLLATAFIAGGLLTARAQILKANNNTSLDQGGSWVGGVAPNLTGIAAWDATVTTATNCTNTLAVSVGWGGIVISNPIAPVKILTNNFPTISLGASGIDLSQATEGLWLAPALTTVADQTWTVTNGLMLTVGEAGQNVTVANNVAINGAILFPNAIVVNAGGSLSIPNGTTLHSTITNNAVTSITVNGAVNQTGGAVTVGRSDSTSGSPKATLVIGSSGAGNYNLSGGSVMDGSTTSDGRVDVGTSSGVTGTWNISGSAAVKLQSLYIANGGNGVVNVTNGSLTVGVNAVRVGTGNNGGTGTINVYGGTISAITGMNVQHSTSAGADNGTLNVYGGNVFVGGSLNVPDGLGAGVVNLDGGLLMATNNVNLPNNASGTGTINLDGGTLQASSIVHNAAGSGTLVFNGGTLKCSGNSSVFITGGIAVDVSTNGAVFDTGNNNISVLPSLLNSIGGVADGGLTKLSSGTLTLAGTNTYNGPTVVMGGTLIVTNTRAIADSTNLIIDLGATLDMAGSGTIALQATPTLNGTLLMQISKNGTTPSSDQLAFTSGTIDCGGTLTVTATGNPLANGDIFQLFSAATISGAFTSINLPPLSSGLVWDTSELNVNGTIKVTTGSGNSTTPPAFNVVTLQNGTNLVFSGSGGTSNGVFFLLTSINLTLPLADWTMVGETNNFDTNGNFNFSYAINPSRPAQFFALSLSPQVLSEADSDILQALQNMRDEGFNSYLPSPGGLYINWIYTNNPPVSTNDVNINYNGAPDPSPTDRHDPDTDIVYLADLVLYRELNSLDPQFDAEINRYTNICFGASDDNFIGNPDQRGWVYWVLQEIAGGIPSLAVAPNAQANKYYNIYTNNLVKFNGQVTPLYIDWNTNDTPGMHGTYTVNLVVEDACVLIVNGQSRGLTNYIAAGEALLNFAQTCAYSTNLNMWADTMGNLFTITNHTGGTVSPPGQQVIYDNSEEASEIGEMTEALCHAEAADPGKGYGPLALATLNKMDPETNTFGLWDDTYGGYFADLILNGTNIQSSTLTTSVNNSYKEVGRAAIIIRSFIFANLLAGANYDTNILSEMNTANLNSYYAAGHGWVYQMNPDYSLYLDHGSGYSVLQNWVTSESIGHAARGLLTCQFPVPQ